MKLEKWALIAEIVGAAAIVISLIFVGLQIRATSVASYAATYDQLAADAMQMDLLMATNSNLRANIQEQYGLEQDDVHYYTRAATRLYERAYLAWRYGRLGEREWERYRSGMCRPVIASFLMLDDALFFDAEYIEFVQRCSQ